MRRSCPDRAALQIVAEAREINQIRDQDDVIQIAVGVRSDHQPIAPAVEHECRIGVGLDSLEEGPIEESLIRREVVLASPDEARDRRVATVGSNNQPCPERPLRAVLCDPHANDSTPILDQSGHLAGHLQIGARLHGGLSQDRIEQQPAYRCGTADVARTQLNRGRELEVLLAQVDAVDKWRAGRSYVGAG